MEKRIGRDVMIKVRVKIPRKVKQYFDKYGTLSYCVNRLFDELGEDSLGLTISATNVNDIDLCTTTVTITSPYYIAYRESFNSRNKFVSVARLLVYAYEIDYCHNWEENIKLTDILNRLRFLTNDEIKKLIEILKEKYL
jgi:hypothetical protein